MVLARSSLFWLVPARSSLFQLVPSFIMYAIRKYIWTLSVLFSALLLFVTRILNCEKKFSKILTSTFHFITGLCRYLEYREAFKPSLNQTITFKQEKNNRCDRSLQAHHVYSTLKRRGKGRFYVVSTWNRRGAFVGFAIADLAKLQGSLAPSIVGHILHELSRFTWYAFKNPARIAAMVSSTEAKNRTSHRGVLWKRCS